MVSGGDGVWKSPALVASYLQGVRAAVPLATEQIEAMMRLVVAGKGPVTSFLDLGCGDGILAAALLEQYPGSKGVLLDFSEPMIQSARIKLQNYRENLVFKIVDYGDSGWIQSATSAQPFDVVVSGFSIHHQPDERKRQLYAEIHDLLRPGGLFVNIEHVSSPTKWIEHVWDNYFIDSLYALSLEEGSTKTRDDVSREFYYRPDKHANILAPVELQCDWLREAGYGDVDCYFKVFELAVFGGRRVP